MNKFNRIANVAIETLKGAAKSDSHMSFMAGGASLMLGGVLSAINTDSGVKVYVDKFGTENEVMKEILRDVAKAKMLHGSLAVVGGMTVVLAVAHYYVTNKEELNKFYLTENERQG